MYDLSIQMILNIQLPFLVEDDDDLSLEHLYKTSDIVIVVIYTTNMPTIITSFNPDLDRTWKGVLLLGNDS
jgi:hypothetical protein